MSLAMKKVVCAAMILFPLEETNKDSTCLDDVYYDNLSQQELMSIFGSSEEGMMMKQIVTQMSLRRKGKKSIFVLNLRIDDIAQHIRCTEKVSFHQKR